MEIEEKLIYFFEDNVGIVKKNTLKKAMSKFKLDADYINKCYMEWRKNYNKPKYAISLNTKPHKRRFKKK